MDEEEVKFGYQQEIELLTWHLNLEWICDVLLTFQTVEVKKSV